MGVLVIVGTDRGAWLLRSDPSREKWKIDGPLFPGWRVSAAARDGRGRYFLGLGGPVYGPGIQYSDDLERWHPVEKGPAYPEGGARRLQEIWTIVPGAEKLYAGVEEAGLFTSDDEGTTWRWIDSLDQHPTRHAWQPGRGGLCLHAVLEDPGNADRIWVGISAVGVFRSDDGGLTWSAKNDGIEVTYEDGEHKEIGFCVHALAADPDDAETIYRQDHKGMYRTGDGGDTWETIQNGLPSHFGFPIQIDPHTKALFAFPMESDECRIPAGGKFRVYRSRDRGDTWEPLAEGLPKEHAYGGVMRAAMAVDGLDPCGVCFGTTSGTLHVSRDRGETWRSLPCMLPRILCVEAFTEE